MILYHGSLEIVREPKILVPGRTLAYVSTTLLARTGLISSILTGLTGILFTNTIWCMVR